MHRNTNTNTLHYIHSTHIHSHTCWCKTARMTDHDQNSDSQSEHDGMELDHELGQEGYTADEGLVNSWNGPYQPPSHNKDNNDSVRRFSATSVDLYQQHKQKSPISVLPAEVLLLIFNHLPDKAAYTTALTTCRAWCDLLIEMIWYRPNITNKSILQLLFTTIKSESQTYKYASYIRRLNLTNLADSITDELMVTFNVCDNLERLSLTNCVNLGDDSLIPIIKNNPSLQSIDISNTGAVTNGTINALSQTCKRLQGMYCSNCSALTDESVVDLAFNCKMLKRIKLTQCNCLSDTSAYAILTNCPSLVEIDFYGCINITNDPIHRLLIELRSLREFRIAFNENINDRAFINFDNDLIFDRLRVLDLTSCTNITDKTVESIIKHTPRLRNVILSKCSNITDRSLKLFSKLGKTLHYVHLGHCSNITDYGVQQLVRSCTKLQYIDLACCTQLTNQTLAELALLPRLKRIGLVKCSNITDEGILTLVRNRQADDTLERIHLSYCTNLGLYPIYRLLMACKRVTHLSLTGINAFLVPDFTRHCRSPPSEFNEGQKQLFCVFSGVGVDNLRKELMRYFSAPDTILNFGSIMHLLPQPENQSTFRGTNIQNDNNNNNNDDNDNENNTNGNFNDFILPPFRDAFPDVNATLRDMGNEEETRGIPTPFLPRPQLFNPGQFLPPINWGVRQMNDLAIIARRRNNELNRRLLNITRDQGRLDNGIQTEQNNESNETAIGNGNNNNRGLVLPVINMDNIGTQNEAHEFLNMFDVPRLRALGTISQTQLNDNQVNPTIQQVQDQHVRNVNTQDVQHAQGQHDERDVQMLDA